MSSPSLSAGPMSWSSSPDEGVDRGDMPDARGRVALDYGDSSVLCFRLWCVDDVWCRRAVETRGSFDSLPRPKCPTAPQIPCSRRRYHSGETFDGLITCSKGGAIGGCAVLWCNRDSRSTGGTGGQVCVGQRQRSYWRAGIAAPCRGAVWVLAHPKLLARKRLCQCRPVWLVRVC